jgi:hypothetical protein
VAGPARGQPEHEHGHAAGGLPRPPRSAVSQAGMGPARCLSKKTAHFLKQMRSCLRKCSRGTSDARIFPAIGPRGWEGIRERRTITKPRHDTRKRTWAGPSRSAPGRSATTGPRRRQTRKRCAAREEPRVLIAGRRRALHLPCHHEYWAATSHHRRVGTRRPVRLSQPRLRYRFGMVN